MLMEKVTYIPPDSKAETLARAGGVFSMEHLIQTQGELEEREKDLDELSGLWAELDLTRDEQEELRAKTKTLWPLLNSLRGDENSIRFAKWRERVKSVNPNFQESNWKHSVVMVEKMGEMKRLFPELWKQLKLDSKRMVLMIMVHDVAEFLYGDMEAMDQVEGDNIQIKKDREAEAALLIAKNLSRERVRQNEEDWGEEFKEILNEYEDRETLGAAMVKMLDVLSGDETFEREVMQCLADNREILQDEEMELALERNYQVNSQKRREYLDLFAKRGKEVLGLATETERQQPFVKQKALTDFYQLMNYLEDSPHQEENWRENRLSDGH